MNKLRIIGVIPGQAGDNTETPGRKFLQVQFAPQAEAGTLNTQRDASKNVWAGFKGKGAKSGFDLSIKADALFTSISEHLNLPADYNWANVQKEAGVAQTPAAFKGLIGMKVDGDIVTEYVEPYEIENSQSQNATRVRYTAVVLNGEDKFTVFQGQNHPIVSDPAKLQELQAMASEIALENQAAKLERKAARASTGAHTAV